MNIQYILQSFYFIYLLSMNVEVIKSYLNSQDDFKKTKDIRTKITSGTKFIYDISKGLLLTCMLSYI